MEQSRRSEFNQKDSDILTRDRSSRFLCAIGLPILVIALSFALTGAFASFFKLPSFLGTVLGFGLSALMVLWLIPRIYVTNEAVSAFVTVDLLTKELVSYGPGFHFSFPWEARSGANNVSLEEVAEDFNFTVQTPTGTLNGEGSIRLRPDIRQLPEFLAGVASVAADATDLVSAKCVGYFATETSVRSCLGKLGSLNTFLAGEFKRGAEQGKDVTDFESRFGVIIGDVTVNKLLPSAEVQKAMDGASEREALDSIICSNLGYATMEEVRKAVKDKELTSEQVAYATENALAMTNNLHGMNLGRQTYTIRLQGDPELVDVAKSIASSPATATLINTLKGQKPQKGK